MDTTLVKTIVDSTITKADTTLVKTVIDTTEKTIWQDTTLMQTFGIIGGLILVMVIILIATRDKKPKK